MNHLDIMTRMLIMRQDALNSGRVIYDDGDSVVIVKNSINHDSNHCEHKDSGKICYTKKECKVCQHCHNHCPQHMNLKPLIETKYNA